VRLVAEQGGNEEFQVVTHVHRVKMTSNSGLKLKKSAETFSKSSTVNVLRANPEGFCCICGLYNAYDTRYPPELVNHEHIIFRLYPFNGRIE